VPVKNPDGRFYPTPVIPCPQIWRQIDDHVKDAKAVFEDADILRSKVKELKSEVEEKCDLPVPWIGRAIGDFRPSCKQKREELSQVSKEVRTKEAEARHLADLTIREVVAAYRLFPPQISAHGMGNDPPVDWDPKFYGCDVKENGHCGAWTKDERNSGSSEINARTTPDGRIQVLREPFFHSIRQEGGADRVALAILHETIHWADRVAFGEEFWTHEAHRTEERAYEIELDFTEEVRRRTGRTVITADEEDEWRKRLLHHKLAPSKIPNQYGWVGIADHLRVGSGNNETGGGTEGDAGLNPESIKLEGDQAFINAWDERTEKLLAKIKKYNEKVAGGAGPRKREDGKPAGSRDQERWNSTYAHIMIGRFSRDVCAFFEGNTNSPPAKDRIESLFGEIDPSSFPHAVDPSPMRSAVSCKQWFEEKIEFFSGRAGERWLNRGRLDELWREYSGEKTRVKELLTPVTIPKAVSQPRHRKSAPPARSKPERTSGKPEPVPTFPVEEPTRYVKPGCRWDPGLGEICPKGTYSPDANWQD